MYRTEIEDVFPRGAHLQARVARAVDVPLARRRACSWIVLGGRGAERAGEMVGLRRSRGTSRGGGGSFMTVLCFFGGACECRMLRMLRMPMLMARIWG